MDVEEVQADPLCACRLSCFYFFGKGFLIDGFNLNYLFMFYVYAKKPRGNIAILNKFNK